MTDPFTDLPVTPADDPNATAASVRGLVVRAPQVVLAAGALRSPAILQASGFRHPAIGHHLRVHPVSVLAARMTEPVDMWRGTMQAAASMAFAAADATRRGFVIESAPGHPGLMALALPWSGAIDHADRMASARHLAPLIAITRDGGEGRTSVTRAGRVRIDYRLDPLGIAALRAGLVASARLARAAGGAEELVAVSTPAVAHRLGAGDAAFDAFLTRLGTMDFSPNRGGVFSAHQMGTLRMGAEPADHPTDPRGRVRGDRGSVVPGLYAADGSTFPTAIGVNPMLGIMTMARRVSRTILDEGRAAG
jgi:choline dehydrogenase-like flavoprotein